MFQKFILNKLIESKLKDVPKEQREMLVEAVSNNPELFKQIAEEIKQRTDNGEDQMSATMAVMKNHEGELRGILNK